MQLPPPQQNRRHKSTTKTFLELSWGAVAPSRMIKNVGTKIPVLLPASQVSWGWWHTWCTLKFSKWPSALGRRTGDRIPGTTDGPSGECHRSSPPSACWDGHSTSPCQESQGTPSCQSCRSRSPQGRAGFGVWGSSGWPSSSCAISRYRAFVNKQHPQLPTQIERSH